MKQAAAVIRQEIAERGPISFARFMELALYHPDYGYYEEQPERIGRRGDYCTAVSVGSLLGEMLAQRCAQWLEELGDREFHLFEAGAHDGRLARDMLAWFGQDRPDLAARLHYWVVEPSPRRRAWQAQTLAQHLAQVRWLAGWRQLAGKTVRGVIFSVELLDAFPTHRLGWNAATKGWFEWGVTIAKDGFTWVRLPGQWRAQSQPEACADGGLSAVIENRCFPAPGLQEVLPDEFIIEVNLAALAWWQMAARCLGAGKLLTIDYGLTAEQLFAPERPHGTLRCYHRHHAGTELLQCPGEQDLTSHVNVAALQSVGELEGLTTVGLVSQEKFLTRLAQEIWQSDQPGCQWTEAQLRQFKTLVHPDHFGRRFQILIQAR
jgi:SAM-dependent MidA family methyltransferase